METNLDNIIQQATSVSRANDILVQEEQVKLAGAERQTEAHANNLVRAATLSTQSAQVAALGNMEAKNLALDNATALGTNSLDVNNMLIPLSTSIRANMVAHKAASAKVNEIERNSDLISNPMGWLKDLLVGDEARADRDSLASSIDTDSRHLKTLHDLTQEDVQTQLALAQTSTVESIQANADAGVALAQAQAAEVRARAMQFSVEGIRALRANNNNAWNRNLQIYNAKAREATAAKDLELREEQLVIAKSNASRAKNKADGDTLINANINTGRAARGLAPIPVALTAAEYNSNTRNGEQYRYFAALGQASMDRGSAVVGFTPAGTLRSFDMYGGSAEQILGDTNAGQILVLAQQEILQTAALIKAGKLSEDDATYGLTGEALRGKGASAAIDNAINLAFNDKLESFDKGFPERDFEVEGLLMEFPELKETELFKTLIEPGLASGIKSVKPSELAKQAAELFSTGEISSSQIADELVGFVTTAQAYSAAAGGRTAMGMALPVHTQLKVRLPYTADAARSAVGNFLKAPMAGATALALSLGASYPSLPQAVGALMDGTQSVDLSSETSVSAYFAKFRSAKVAEELQAAATKDTP